MAPSSVEEYQRLINRANEYHKQALWQEKLRLLQEALLICEDPAFPEADRRKQELLFDVAGIWRRLGQYDRAEKTLQQSLEAYASPTSSFRASVMGKKLTDTMKIYEKYEEFDLLWPQANLV